MFKQILQNQKTESPIEEILLKRLEEYGLVPRLQHKVGYFFIDLAFPGIKLAIEADGKAYHKNQEQWERDRYRQKRIESQGWIFERFDGSFIHRYGDVAAAKIALRYFEERLNKEQRKKAVGRIVRYFSQNDPELALHLTNLYLKEKSA